MKSGYLFINKPKDWTSFDVVKKVRNILKIKKIGHIGTLDPFATGLLILLINKATRISEYITNYDKEYIAQGRFGLATDSGDITGKITQEKNHPPITKAQFEKLIPEILNITSQIPSKFSAIKIQGQKAYQKARQGADFQMPERTIQIKEFELLDFDFPDFTYRAVVSKGTYIRTLTEQIADLFGYIATTINLHRTKIDDFNVCNSMTIEQIINEQDLHVQEDYDILLPHIKKINISTEEKKKFLTGEGIIKNNLSSLPSISNPMEVMTTSNEEVTNNTPKSLTRIYHNQSFLGIGFFIYNPSLNMYSIKPEKVLYSE